MADGLRKRRGLRRVVKWVALGVACALVLGLAGGATDRLAPYAGDEAPNSDSARVDEIFEQAFAADPQADLVILAPFSSAERLTRILRETPEVAVTDPAPLRQGARRLVYIRALLQPGPASQQQDVAQRLRHDLAAPGVQVGGSVLGYAQANRVSTEDLSRAEAIALPILFLCLLIVFRSAVSALIPIAFAFLSIVSTLAILSAMADITTISVFALNLVAALGIGLSIDFSLLIISRFREEFRGRDIAAARRATMRTAGRTVIYSCLTIIAALSALIVFPAGLLRSLGIGGVVVTAVAGAFAVVVLPRLLMLLGRRIDALALPWWRETPGLDSSAGSSARWGRWSRWVVSHGVLGTVIGIVLLVVLAAPAIDLHVTSAASSSNLPASSSARQADDSIEAVSGASASPIVVIAGGREEAVERAAIRRQLAQSSVVSNVRAAHRDGYAFLEASLRGEPFSAAAESLVSELRSEGALVSGRTAAFLDYRAEIEAKLPLAIVIALGATMLLLFLLSRSFVIPVKAVLANVFTIAAVFGVLVWTLQNDHLDGLLGYRGEGALIDPTIPIFIAALSFGLSTDYGVFLLSRALEGKGNGLSDRDAVANALAHTGRLITSLALLFCVAVGAVATSRIATIKEAGIGMVVAVLIDATIVRSLLVPALMSVLGKWNWWAPHPLAKLGGIYSIGDDVGARQGAAGPTERA